MIETERMFLPGYRLRAKSDSGNSREDLECTVSHGDLAARGKNGVTRRSCCQSLEHNTFFI